MRYLGQRRGVAIDVGANKGIYLYHMSRHFRSVLAFEPLPELVAYLQRAAPLNVEVRSDALSSKSCASVLREPRGYNELATLEATDHETWPVSVPVDTHQVRLSALDDFALNDISLIKIDVEGHEFEVLTGAAATIGRCRPTLIVEVEERHRRGSVGQVRQYLEQSGYLGYYVDEGVLRPISNFDAARDQNVANLADSVKTGRYINNFIYFDGRAVSDFLAAVATALHVESAAAD